MVPVGPHRNSQNADGEYQKLIDQIKRQNSRNHNEVSSQASQKRPVVNVQPITINIQISPYLTKSELLQTIKKKMDFLISTKQMENVPKKKKIFIYLERSQRKNTQNPYVPLIEKGSERKGNKELLGIMESATLLQMGSGGQGSATSSEVDKQLLQHIDSANTRKKINTSFIQKNVQPTQGSIICNLIIKQEIGKPAAKFSNF